MIEELAKMGVLFTVDVHHAKKKDTEFINSVSFFVCPLGIT